MNDSIALVNKLSSVEMTILQLVRYLCQLPDKSGRAHRGYCFPSQTWLAKKIGVSRRTIVFHVLRLRMMGILQVIHRRKVCGFWSTNLYIIRDHHHWGWARFRELLTTSFHRAQKAAHIDPPKTEVPSQDSRSKESGDKFSAFLTELTASLGEAKFSLRTK